MDKELSETDKNLQILNKQLSRLNSYSYQFFISIVRGLGTVIGATIVVAITFAIIASILKTTGLYPAIESFMSTYQKSF